MANYRLLIPALAVFLGAAVIAVPGTLRYDQTQTGDTNIHLQIKNVEVVALLDDSALGEYDYDYNDFTEKPTKPGAAASNATSPPSVPIEDSNATASDVTPSSDTTATNATSSEASSNAALAVEPQEPLLGSTTTATDEATSVSTTKKTRRCGAGFYRDTLGRCRRIRRPHLQMMMNLSRNKNADSDKAT